MVVEETCAVHVAWWSVPIQPKRNRCPTTQHEHINHATVVHVKVIPVVHPCANDNHGFTVRFVGIFGKFTGNLNHFFTAYACDGFLPCRCACDGGIIVIIGNVLTANPICHAKVCHH